MKIAFCGCTIANNMSSCVAYMANIAVVIDTIAHGHCLALAASNTFDIARSLARGNILTLVIA
jgi:hypothetical protein